MASINLSVKTKLSWWVMPLLYVCGLAAALRIPVDEDRAIDLVMHHGVHITFNSLR